MREAEQTRVSKAQWRFKVLDFTKETKSEETVVATRVLIYKYIEIES